MQLLIMKQDRGGHSKGDIVEIRATDTLFGGLEPNAFVLVEVDVPMAAYEMYNEAWKDVLDYEVINQNLALDGFRLRVFSTMVSIGGKGGITKNRVETYLNKWNASVVSFDVNSVTFDFSIYNAVQSAGFWEIPLAGIIFSEVSYNQGTGIHQIQIDYSVLGNSPTYVERYISRKGMKTVSHKDKVLVGDIARSDVLNEFKRDVKEKVERIIERRRYHVSFAVVDNIISQGGKITTTEIQVQNYIKDKLDE